VLVLAVAAGLAVTLAALALALAGLALALALARLALAPGLAGLALALAGLALALAGLRDMAAAPVALRREAAKAAATQRRGKLSVSGKLPATRRCKAGEPGCRRWKGPWPSPSLWPLLRESSPAPRTGPASGWTLALVLGPGPRKPRASRLPSLGADHRLWRTR